MKLFSSFKYAFTGIGHVIRDQSNMRIHLFVSVIMVMAGFYLDFNYLDWSIFVLTAGAVIGMEAMNTSVEELVNLVSPERKILAGKIKDIAAGAVLVVSIAAFIVGVLLVISKL